MPTDNIKESFDEFIKRLKLEQASEEEIIKAIANKDNEISPRWVSDLAAKHVDQNSWKELLNVWKQLPECKEVKQAMLLADQLKNIITNIELNSETYKDAKLLVIIIQGIQEGNIERDEGRNIAEKLKNKALPVRRQDAFKPIYDGAIGLYNNKLKNLNLNPESIQEQKHEEKKDFETLLTEYKTQIDTISKEVKAIKIGMDDVPRAQFKAKMDENKDVLNDLRNNIENIQQQELKIIYENLERRVADAKKMLEEARKTIQDHNKVVKFNEDFAKGFGLTEAEIDVWRQQSYIDYVDTTTVPQAALNTMRNVFSVVHESVATNFTRSVLESARSIPFFQPVMGAGGHAKVVMEKVLRKMEDNVKQLNIDAQDCKEHRQNLNDTSVNVVQALEKALDEIEQKRLEKVLTTVDLGSLRSSLIGFISEKRSFWEKLKSYNDRARANYLKIQLYKATKKNDKELKLKYANEAESFFAEIASRRQRNR